MSWASASTTRRISIACAVTALCALGNFSLATEAAAPSAAPTPAAPPAGKYKLDRSHASLVLRANHMGFSTYTTRFSRFDAAMDFDPKNLPASKLETTIESSSFEMNAAPQLCLDIMKGAQMLDTVKYPQIVFKSSRIHVTGANTMEVTGALTLHGVTRPIVLKATYNGGYAGMPGMDPQARIGFSAHGAIKRSDYGITFGIPPAGSKIGVGDSIDIAIEAEFTGPPLAAKPSGGQ